jgi:phosphoglycolate phosphatase
MDIPVNATLMPWRLRQFDAAIVDLDGTLVDTLGDFVEALQRMLRDLPAPFADFTVTHDLVERMVGKGSENLIKSLLAHVDIAQSAIDLVALYEQAWARYQVHYQAINGDYSTVYPGALEGLQQWQAAGLRLVCVTNKPTAFARTLLQHKGLDGFFLHVVGGDAVARKKPDPLPLLYACDLLGTQPARTLMVGDSSNDAQAARSAGCPVLLVRYGYNHGEPVESVDADAYADALDALRWAD